MKKIIMAFYCLFICSAAGAQSINYSNKDYDKYNFELYAMPGIGYVQHNFNGSDSIGNFSGMCIDVLLWSKVHQNDDFGPSHVKVFTKFNLNKGSRSEMGRLFYYSIGIQMSIEKNPKRNFLVPFFGGELGGITQRELGTTTVFFPQAGIYLLATKNVFINAYAGYMYPMQKVDYLSGYSLQASFNFALW